MERILNLFKLIQILRERGNWVFIKRNRRQLRDFILCRDGLNKRSLVSGLFHWLHMLKGLDVLVWRLETFGFLFLPTASEQEKQDLNHYL